MKSKNLLFFVVFITGGIVLVVEVLAFRILLPYFGNTLYSTSSILGVILAGLSVGYILGGKLSERFPNYFSFSLLIWGGAISIFWLIYSYRYWLEKLVSFFDLKWGPLLSALFLFFPFSCFLGTVSPFAIKLLSLSNRKVGHISGYIFSFSTIGSILGSILAGFYLVPYFSLIQTLLFMGFLLIFLGFLLCPYHKLLFFWIIFFLSFLLLGSSFLAKKSKFLFEKEGMYTPIRIGESEYKGRKVRILWLGKKAPQSAMYLDSKEIPFDYQKYVFLYKAINPKIERVLILGGGAYIVPKSLLLEKNEIKEIEVVEIEPLLYKLARKYFELPRDKRLKNYIVDGRVFLTKTNKKYDLIFCDVYSGEYIPPHFTTQEFFLLVKEKLTPSGIFLMNIIGSLANEKNQYLLSQIKTFLNVFPRGIILAVESVKKKELQNFIFLATSKKIDFKEFKIRAEKLKIISNFENHFLQTQLLNLESAFILKDNLNPLDLFLLKQYF